MKENFEIEKKQIQEANAEEKKRIQTHFGGQKQYMLEVYVESMLSYKEYLIKTYSIPKDDVYEREILKKAKFSIDIKYK